MKPTVFIQTNHKQIIGALVAEYSLKRNSKHADAFDVRIMHTKDFPFLWEREGQDYLRDGVTRQWHMDDLQSFTPTRFLPPQLMGYQGRAVVIDPDVFAVGRHLGPSLPRYARARRSWRGRAPAIRKRRE